MRIVWVLSHTYPERYDNSLHCNKELVMEDISCSCVMIPGCQDEVHLVDDAFAKLCQAIGDLSVNVRTLAAELLGSMVNVNPHFLEQTLDKKLMSDMRVIFYIFVLCFLTL